jgi:hypothetical protein
MIITLVTCTDSDVDGKSMYYVGNPFWPGPYDNSENDFKVGDVLIYDEKMLTWKKK